MKPNRLSWLGLSAVLLLSGCGAGTEPAPDELGADDSELVTSLTAEAQGVVDAASDGLNPTQQQQLKRGARLFFEETFKGNGRTCSTCHSFPTGTVSPAQANARRNRNQNDPLFRSIDSDDGKGSSYTQILQRATVNVTIPLAANVSIKERPGARSVTLRRGVPTVVDMPALDPHIMLDGRQPTLAAQALGAANDHAQVKQQPTAQQLADIVALEKTAFFSSREMLKYARGTGPAPGLPAGTTASEKRGRAFFDGPTTLCGGCHSGALLDGNVGPGTPPQARFLSVGVSEINFIGRPVLTYVFKKPDGTKVEIVSPDPGRALISGDPAEANAFKMTSLRNLKNTAPYFHDNSALTLEEVAEHYDRALNGLGIADLSEQDKQDLVAFMKLL